MRPNVSSVGTPQNIRSFRRFELKFVVVEPVAARFLTSLQPWTEVDPVTGAGSYRIESLYYDTADLRFYWEKVDGLRLRRKIRIRRYLDGTPATDRSEVHLEIKQRLDRVTQKRRIGLGLDQATAFLDQGRRPPLGDPVLDEVEVMADETLLRPTLVTGYDRTARIGGVNDPGLRITFDRDCYYRADGPSLLDVGAAGPMLPAGWVIVEIKVNDRLPGWLADLIADNGLAMTRISKYVQGVERAALAPRSVFFHDVERPPPKRQPAALVPARPLADQPIRTPLQAEGPRP